MPKTKDAFAFRDFDEERILQRRYFKDFHFDEDKTDAEIIAAMSANDFDSFETTQKKIDALDVLLAKAAEYQKHIERHGARLTKYAHAVAHRIATDEQSDISLLRGRHKRAGNLSQKYSGCVSDIDGTTTYFRGGIVVDDVGRLCQKIAKSYKVLDEKIKLHYRKIFASRLKQARKTAGLTQEKIAPKVGLTKNGYALYETAKRDPSIPTLIRLTKELNCTADCLLGIS